MEVGAVKQAFNNEVIQLKKSFNQAKIQIIHKLTRKAKTFTDKKKAPDKIKEKLKRKAESAVNEVLIMKKIKPKVLAKFAVTHKGNLQDYLNRPVVDQDKACARLLLHKSLQEKYTYIRNTFSNIPISDLLMSRIERRKMKKEALEKQKMKRDKKQQVVNAEGEWDVEKVKTGKNTAKEMDEDDGSSDDDNAQSDVEGNSDEDERPSDNDELNDDDERSESEVEPNNESDEEVKEKMETDEESDHEDLPDEDSSDEGKNVGKFVRPSPVKEDVKLKIEASEKLDINTNPVQAKSKSKPEFKKPTKPRDPNKNKKLNEKLISRNFKKESSEAKVPETKIVDPFFITSSGDNYMSVVEPRQPDEVKEIHRQGNRQMRRAAMFGHAPKIKPRQDFRESNFNRQNDSQGFRNNRNESKFNGRNDSQFRGRNDNQFNKDDSKFKGRNDKFGDRNDSQFKGNRNDGQFKGKSDSFKGRIDAEPKEEKKLHPSWEAKKKKSGILPFQGKKIVFDES